MKKIICIIAIFILISHSSLSSSQVVVVEPAPDSYQPFGPFDCLQGWRQGDLCTYDFLEAVICELAGPICWFDEMTHETTFRRNVFIRHYWEFVVNNSGHEFESPTTGLNLTYFNSLSFDEQSEIYALTICHINSDACYLDDRGVLSIYQAEEVICEIIDDRNTCRRPSDGAICQISPQACGSLPD